MMKLESNYIILFWLQFFSFENYVVSLFSVLELDYHFIFLFHSVTGIMASGLTLVPVKGRALQTFTSRSTLLIEWGIGFTSNISLLMCWALLKVFLSKFLMQLTNKELKLFEIINADWNFSYLPTKSWS